MNEFEPGQRVRFADKCLTSPVTNCAVRQFLHIDGSGSDFDVNQGVVWTVVGPMPNAPVDHPAYRLETADGKRTCWARSRVLERAAK